MEVLEEIGLGSEEVGDDCPVNNEGRRIPMDKFKDTFDNPTCFVKAWYHPDKFQLKMWRAAIAKEFRKMDELKV